MKEENNLSFTSDILRSTALKDSAKTGAYMTLKRGLQPSLRGPLSMQFLLTQRFSDLNVHRKYPGILLQCRQPWGLKGGLRLSRSNQVTYGWSEDWILRSKTLIVQMHQGRWGWCGKLHRTTPARAQQRVQPQVHHSGLAVRRAEGLVIGLSSQATLPTLLSPLQLEPGTPKGPFFLS